MERRRPRLDPMLAEHVSERLALVLADRPPRRAQVVDDQPAPPVGQPSAEPGPAPGPRSDQTRVENRHAPDNRPQTDSLSTAGPDAIEELDSLNGLPPARRFSRRHLTVLVGLVVVGLLLAGWSLFRARPVAVATPGAVLVSSSAPASSGSASARAPSSTKASIVVHVLGAVRRPGLVTLPEPARVQDAIDAAGGLKSGADPGELNLAQQLGDGQQVVIGSKSDPPSEVRDRGPGPASGGEQSGSGASTVLDLNRATSAQLEALPGVGPVTAAKILAWRQEHSRFSRVEELQEVDGIGPKIYAQIAPHIRV